MYMQHDDRIIPRCQIFIFFIAGLQLQNNVIDNIINNAINNNIIINSIDVTNNDIDSKDKKQSGSQVPTKIDIA